MGDNEGRRVCPVHVRIGVKIWGMDDGVRWYASRFLGIFLQQGGADEQTPCE